MFKMTQRAAQQVFHSAKESHMEGLALRIAAKRLPDGSIEYGMGFDDIHEEDILIHSKGVEIIFDATHKELLSGTVMDFVELEPGDFQFIFLNPNDPHFVPPQEEVEI